jgi:hypothetical protein
VHLKQGRAQIVFLSLIRTQICLYVHRSFFIQTV